MYPLASVWKRITQLHLYYKCWSKPCERIKFQKYIWQLTPQKSCTLYEALNIEYFLNNLAITSWIVLIVASVGVVYSGYHFAQIYRQSSKEIPTWRKRTYKWLSYNTLKMGRFVGSFVTMSTWLMLLIGVVKSMQHFISAWIMINSAFLCFDLLFLACKIIFSKQRISLRAAVVYMWPVVFNMFVRTIYNALEDELNPTCKG